MSAQVRNIQAALDSFTQHWAGTKPKTETKARVLWDRENLYFIAELEDHDLFADLTEHDARAVVATLARR